MIVAQEATEPRAAIDVTTPPGGARRSGAIRPLSRPRIRRRTLSITNPLDANLHPSKICTEIGYPQPLTCEHALHSTGPVNSRQGRRDVPDLMPAPDLFRPLRLEVEKRAVRVTKLEVIKNTTKPESPAPLSFPGTVTVFIARKGTRALDEVRAAVAQGGESVQKLQQSLKKQFQGRREISVEEYVKRLPREPVFADIRYGGATLNSGVFLPKGLNLVAIAFPYNGGRLAPEGFALAEHYKDDSDTALEGLVVRTDPPLTEPEKAALRLVPSSQLSRNVGFFDSCHTTWWAVFFVATAVAATFAVACAVVSAPDTHISEQELEKMGPAASARALLALRRQILEKALAKTKL